MSFWVLSYFTLEETDGTGVETSIFSIYKTQDDAILKAISLAAGELVQTPDGTIWHNDPTEVDEPIKLEDLKHQVRQSGYLDKDNPSRDRDLSEATKYFIIQEAKLENGPDITPRKVTELKQEVACHKCGQDFEVDFCHSPHGFRYCDTCKPQTI